MAHYIPLTPSEEGKMLQIIGISSREALFEAIPEDLKLKEALRIPDRLSEMEVSRHLSGLAAKNKDHSKNICFLGAGLYDHFIPAAVNHLAGRQEFYTAYTPYQPEISQGTLQAIFEYQSMICELTGMDAANASMYDGATALYEAVVLATRSTGRNGVLVARSVYPDYRRVLQSCLKHSQVTIDEIPYVSREIKNRQNSGNAPEKGQEGRISLTDLLEKANQDIAAIVVQSPNFFGIVEDIKQIADMVKQKGILVIAVCDPISLGILEAPGNLGADIAVGEAQPLGNSISFGGPLLGYFAVKSPFIRKIPGRIAGETVDTDGKRGFVLTLQAREQHIRREKAISNICSNQALCALKASIYLSLVGKNGLREIASQCLNKSAYLYKELIGKTGCQQVFSAPFFKEFVIKPSTNPGRLNHFLLNEGIIGGYDLSNDYPELEGCWLVAVTEKRTREEMDHLVNKVLMAREEQK